MDPDARLSGMASSSADNLVAFVETLIKIAGQPEPALPPLLAGKFTFDGAVEVSQTAIAAKRLQAGAGPGQRVGARCRVTLKPCACRRGQARRRQARSRPVAGRDRAPAAPPAPAPPPPAGSPATPAPPAGPSMLAADHRQARVRGRRGDLQQAADPQHGARTGRARRRRRRAEAHRDPAGRHGAAGQVDPVGRSGATDRRPASSAWSGRSCARPWPGSAIDVSSVPASKLTRLSMKGRMASSGGNVQVSDAVFELDDLKGSGGIVVTFSVPLSVVTQVDLDTLDLDSYLPPRRPPRSLRLQRRRPRPARRRRALPAPRSGSRPRSPSSIYRQARRSAASMSTSPCSGEHAPAERLQGRQSGRRAAGGARHGGQLLGAAAAARHRLQFRSARHGSRAEARRRPTPAGLGARDAPAAAWRARLEQLSAARVRA